MLGGNAKKSRSANAKVDTLIGHETEIAGDVRFSGGLHIDGVVKGNVIAESDSDSVAIVSERGRVEGELRVPNVLINGYVAGDVYASARLDLATNARVHGDVYYHTIEMAGGAEINGKLVRTDQTPQRFLEHQERAAAAGGDEAAADEAAKPQQRAAGAAQS
ncbi:MAG: polymer-forming cytoskeletal protein [Halofilum sp. (in: g-proteobacteria)]|nr:polymer-forming cytoskeletal protein [Halofilum sp. (in: g-proteobacteria)]